MDWKALRKTFTPTKDELITTCAFIVFIVISFTLIFGIVFGVGFICSLLAAKFGPIVNNIGSGIMLFLVVCSAVWFIIVEPLVERYKRKKRENKS